MGIHITGKIRCDVDNVVLIRVFSLVIFVNFLAHPSHSFLRSVLQVFVFQNIEAVCDFVYRYTNLPLVLVDWFYLCVFVSILHSASR